MKRQIAALALAAGFMLPRAALRAADIAWTNAAGGDFSNPLNLVPVAAGIIIAIGNTSMVITPDFVLSGIALGTIVTVVAYHLARALAPAHLRERADGAGIVLTHPGSDDLGELGLEDDFGRARSPLDER